MANSPPVPPSVWKWPIALAGLFFFVFATVTLSGPGRIDIVDGQTRYEVARSLVEHGDSVIRDKDVWFAVLPGRNGQPYTNYRLPQTVLGVLAIWVADATGPTDEERRQFFFTLIGPLACGLLAVSYALWFHYLGYGTRASLAWAAAGIFCTPSWYYGTSSFDDILGAAAVVPAVAAAFLCKERCPLFGAAVAGLFLGWAINCKQPLGLFVLPVLGAAYRPELTLRAQLRPFALIVLGLVLGGIVYKAYDIYKFPAGTAERVQIEEEKFGAIWVTNPVPGLAGLAVSPAAGALWYCPTILLSYLGWRRWRNSAPWFCGSLLVASLGFTLFVSFLTFFKGDPAWGPRYLTPVFALWWVFVPAAAKETWRVAFYTLLVLGVGVQLLALSVEPLRLFFRIGLPIGYYNEHRWLGFDPATSHLFRRPWEIREILGTEEASPEFAPAPLPTFAPTLRSPFPMVLTSSIGNLVAPQPAAPLNGAAVLASWSIQDFDNQKDAIGRYHIFSSLRPFWLCQQYLPPRERPVALLPTVLLLGGIGLAGLGLMLVSGLPVKMSRPRVQA